MKLAKTLGAVGRVLLTVGVLTLLFVAYQLWGTGIHEARAQDSLSNEFDESLAELTPPTDDETPAPPFLNEGDAIARIEIPAIGVDKIVVEGVGMEDLKRGPGRFPGTPLPGQEGNASIAGHRTTYGAPFHRIDELEEGDEIRVTTAQGEFRYLVSEQLIVSPDQVEVLEDHDDTRLTLVACHPKYSAAQRIVVVAELDESDQPALPPSDIDDDGAADPQPVASDLDAGAGLSGDRSGAWPAVGLALVCAAIWLAAWLSTKLVTSWVSYGVGAPLFLVVLFFCFEETSRFLPANF